MPTTHVGFAHVGDRFLMVASVASIVLRLLDEFIFGMSEGASASTLAHAYMIYLGSTVCATASSQTRGFACSRCRREYSDALRAALRVFVARVFVVS